MSVKLIIGIVVAAVVLFIALTIYSILSKSGNAKNYEPYKSLLAKELHTVREVVLISGDIASLKFVDYRMYDTTYTYAALIEAANPKWVLPAGTKLVFEKARIYENGVSGSVWGFLIGTVALPDIKEPVSFEYQWGDKHSFYNTDKKETDYRWDFPLAPWQDQPDTTVYQLPKRP